LVESRLSDQEKNQTGNSQPVATTNECLDISRSNLSSGLQGKGIMIALAMLELSIVDMMNCSTDLELADPEVRILIDDFVEEF